MAYYVTQTATHVGRRYKPLYLCPGWTAKHPVWSGDIRHALPLPSADHAKEVRDMVFISSSEYKYGVEMK